MDLSFSQILSRINWYVFDFISGKTIEEGMSHIFLPFSGDLYIGVTAHE
jgi:hypothetical protein